MPHYPKRGDVYFVEFNSARGSEQSGIRPAVVISNNRSNYASPVITVIPITHTKSSRKYPQNVDLPAGIFDSLGGTILWPGDGSIARTLQAISWNNAKQSNESDF